MNRSHNAKNAVTLLQTIPLDAATPGAWLLPALEISDATRFGWRGLMLDSAPFSAGREARLHGHLRLLDRLGIYYRASDKK